MKLEQIAKNIHESLKLVSEHYIGSDNIWGLALAFSSGGSEEGYQSIINHPQYGDGDALFAAYDKVYEEWFAMMEKHDMWPVVGSSVPENFVFEHPSKVH